MIEELAVATFDTLKFEPHPSWPNGIRAVAKLPNGVEISIVRGQHSYGGEEGFYEAYIIRGGSKVTLSEFDLTCSRRKFHDPLGWLTPFGVGAFLLRAACL